MSSTTQPAGPSAYLLPAQGLPFGAVLVPYLGPKRGYGPAGFAQYRSPEEREIHLAGVRGALALAYQAAQSAGDGIPARPLDFYVCTLDHGQQREIGFLSKIRGNPYPPFVWAGQGVGSRPTLSATAGATAGAIAVGSDPAPPSTFGQGFVSSLLPSGSWSPWTTIPAAPMGRVLGTLAAVKAALKAAGVRRIVEALITYQSGTQIPDPALSSVQVIELLERRDPRQEDRQQKGKGEGAGGVLPEGEAEP